MTDEKTPPAKKPKGKRGGFRTRNGGRPKGALSKVTLDLRRAAQEYTTEALAVMASIMKDKEAPHAARVSAATGILDRGHGKPKQAHDVTFTPHDLSKLTDAELELLDRITAKSSVEGSNPDGDEAPGRTPPSPHNGAVH